MPKFDPEKEMRRLEKEIETTRVENRVNLDIAYWKKELAIMGWNLAISKYDDGEFEETHDEVDQKYLEEARNELDAAHDYLMDLKGDNDHNFKEIQRFGKLKHGHIYEPDSGTMISNVLEDAYDLSRERGIIITTTFNNRFVIIDASQYETKEEALIDTFKSWNSQR